MGRPIKKSVLHDILLDVNVDGTNIDTVGGNPADSYMNTLLDGQPDFLDYVEGRGNLTTLDTNFGWDADGMWFFGNAGSDTPCYPIYTDFVIPAASKTVVSWTFPYPSPGCTDHGVCVYLDGDVPEWKWGYNSTRIAASFNCGVPWIYGLSEGNSVQANFTCTEGETYLAVFTYDPVNSMCQFDTLSAQGATLSSIQLTERLADGDYVVGFVADDEEVGTRAYFKYLNIDIAPANLENMPANGFLASTYNGLGSAKLVATDTPAENEASLIATDYNGSTYWVTKLGSHLATLQRRTMVGSYEYPDGYSAKWHFDAPTVGNVVQLNNA